MEIPRERYICKWREAEEDSVDRPEYRAARKNLARARAGQASVLVKDFYVFANLQK